MTLKKIQLKLLRKLRILKRDIILLWKSPIEYIYSFTYPTDQYVNIKPYDPSVKAIGKILIDKVHAIYPLLKILFIGSAVLGIAGQKDIDLIIESDPKDFHLYIAGLVSVFGRPKKTKKNLVEWITTYKDCNVEALLIGKSNPIGQKSIQTFKRIQRNKNLIREYENLKLKSNGVSIREYKRRRIEFFNYVDGR